MARKRWSKEDTKKFKELYPHKSNSELLVIFSHIEGISEKSLIKKANYHGIKKSGKTRSDISRRVRLSRDDSWSEEEFEILKRLYPKYGSVGVQKELPHRTIKSIHGKAQNNDIRFEAESNWVLNDIEFNKEDIFSVEVNYTREDYYDGEHKE